jgi:PAS domain S-box-containing protein
MPSTSSAPRGSEFSSVAVEPTRMGVFHFDVQSNRLTYSDELLALVGTDRAQVGGTTGAVEIVMHPDDVVRCRKVLSAGERLDHDFRIIRPDGEVRWMHWRGEIVRRCGGAPIEVRGVTLDVTDRKRVEENVHLMIKELSHRSKNLMAVVQAISWQTAQRSFDLEEFEQLFARRLEALARCQDLLVSRDWRWVALQDLVRAQLDPFLDAKERLVARGPALLLMPLAAQDLGLALHELATNASKYGALSAPSGKVEIGWTVAAAGAADSKQFHMTWRESGGPTVSRPVRKGFGSTVITATIARTFNGKAELAYRPEGVSWELRAPLGPAFISPAR